MKFPYIQFLSAVVSSEKGCFECACAEEALVSQPLVAAAALKPPPQRPEIGSEPGLGQDAIFSLKPRLGAASLRLQKTSSKFNSIQQPADLGWRPRHGNDVTQASSSDHLKVQVQVQGSSPRPFPSAVPLHLKRAIRAMGFITGGPTEAIIVSGCFHRKPLIVVS